MLFQSYFCRSRYPCAIDEGSFQCRSEEPDSVCLSEFPGENYYSLKILKGNIEPRRYSPGSCADLRVDHTMGRLCSASMTSQFRHLATKLFVNLGEIVWSMLTKRFRAGRIAASNPSTEQRASFDFES